ncbi:paraquat-inducible protein A [Desulfosarcina ovata]|uniref:Paraquat-inducible protein n=1 Tax=Desulfosarcina ovata subsp. ovata TaxID=2752305 RepID=A0A5K8A612_9BACT|nr:paraquat-inducible protein A [Desulfosarcina ovata]BBO87901.1 paraquat-inducible protein [Desulfosarcina ovata subsp. ovata]
MMQPVIACHECDLLQQVKPLPPKSTARCVRCGALLYVHTPDTIDRSLAFAITGLVLMLIANIYPFLSLESQGATLETTLITGTLILARQSPIGLAFLVLLTSMLVPCILMGALVVVLGSIKWGQRLPACRRIFRLALALRPWSMTEVFMLGILVSVVKLAKMATIIPGTALFAFLGLVFVLAAINTVLDPHTVWEKMVP